MHNITKFSSFNRKLYADEKYLCLVENDLEHLEHLVNNELMKVDEWMRLNKSCVNCLKSMCFLREKSIKKAEAKNIISTFTKVMLCYIGKRK